jgi:hypothetical protein
MSLHALHSGSFKLADFGLARIYGSPDRQLTPQVRGYTKFNALSMEWRLSQQQQQQQLLRNDIQAQ